MARTSERQGARACALIILLLVASTGAAAAAPLGSAELAMEAPEIAPGPVVPTVQPGAPHTRTELDGSVTFLGRIMDVAGTLVRTEVPEMGAVSQGIVRGGVFTNDWSENGHRTLTFGTWTLDEDGNIDQTNLFAIEGADDLQDAFVDAVQRDAGPMAVNLLPFVLTHVQPGGVGLFIAAFLGIGIGGGVLAMVVGEIDGELGASVAHMAFFAALAPAFMLGVLYPYHVDPVEGEVYADFPDVYLWSGITRAADQAVYDGTYLSRYGAYEERSESAPDGSSVSFIAEAWKRVVVGPVVRSQGETIKAPGVYVRQDIHRDLTARSDGTLVFDAEIEHTVGVFDETLGESPGASVRGEEHQEGSTVLLTPSEQEGTMSLGVRDHNGDHVPLLGVRTSSWHRPYTDTTNQGQPVGAIEAYRVTAIGTFAGDTESFVPVFGFDVWGERWPLDLWAVFFALNLQGLGDQMVGDLQVRVGTFNLDQDFVALAGARYDDDFAAHRHTFRAMISAGLFLTDPLDPGEPVPGEAPDGARYVPLVAVTYDGVAPSNAWALANALDQPAGMVPWIVSAGTFSPAAVLAEDFTTAYLPLVSLTFEPTASDILEDRRATERYTLYVHPTGDYDEPVEVHHVDYSGDRTSGSWGTAWLLDESPAIGTVAPVPLPAGKGDWQVLLANPGGALAVIAAYTDDRDPPADHAREDWFSIHVGDVEVYAGRTSERDARLGGGVAGVPPDPLTVALGVQAYVCASQLQTGAAGQALPSVDVPC